MDGLLFTNARVVGADRLYENGWLATSGDRIEAFGEGRPDASAAHAREVIDLAGATLLPGFVDVHVHGAVGHEAMDADPDGLAAMSEFFATRGVTSFLATTWSAGTAEILAALTAIAEAMRRPAIGARILGAHMEGPYLSARRAGAHDPATIRPARLSEANAFFDIGVVRRITLAPEVPENAALFDECARRGIEISAGHTDATYEQMEAAVARGVRQVTHVYNAMRPLHHREPGVVGAAFAIPDLVAELIADGVHVHPAAMRALFLAKGARGVMLVTDALRPTGLASGEFTAGGRTVRTADGAVRLADGTLAGSVLTMDVGLRNAVAATGSSLAQLWEATSRNAATAAGVGERKGMIAAGMDADLVVIADEGSVRLTAVEGRVVYRAT